MKDYIKYTFYCSLILILLSCGDKFEPSGKHFVEIDKPAYPEGSISINLDNSEEYIEINNQVNLTYSINTGGLRVYQINLFLDSLLIYSGYKANDSFYYDPNVYDDGYHVLRIEVATNSGSGSLADKLGAEGFVIYQEWIILNIGNSEPSPLSITGSYPYNGQLMVNWERYNKLNFEKYELYTDFRLSTHDTQNDTSFLDPYYIGGSVWYRVDVTASGHKKRGIGYTPISPIPSIKGFEQIDLTSVQLTWSSCIYPGNFGKYKVYMNNVPSNEFTNVEDTSQVFENIPFGKPIPCKVYTYPELDPGYNIYHKWSSDVNIWVGDTIGVTSHDVVYAPESNKIYLLTNKSITVMNNSTMEIETEGHFGSSHDRIAVSPNGNFVVTSTDENISIHDPLTLETIQSIHLEDITGWTPYTYRLTVANNGLLFCLSGHSYGSEDIELLAIDINQSILLDSIMLNDQHLSHIQNIQCSDNGEYVIVYNEMFRFVNNSFSRISEDFNEAKLVFLPGSNQFAYMNYSQNIKVHNLPNLSVAITIDYLSPYIPTIDPVTGFLGVMNGNEGPYNIIDLNTGTFLQEFPTNIYRGYGERLYLFDNKVLSSKGFIRPAFE